MSKLISICLLFLLIFTSFANESISKKQKELAIFYYEVGQRYMDVGKIKKGKTFQGRALKLYPNLLKEVDFNLVKNMIDNEFGLKDKLGSVAFENISILDIPSIIHDKIEINDITNAPKIEYIALEERRKNQVQAVKFQFGKFIRAFVFKNKLLLDSVLDDEIKVNGKTFDKTDFIQDFEKSLSKINPSDLEYLSIDDFYNLNSLNIKKENDTYNIKISANLNSITRNLKFWNSSQTLGFVQKKDKWLLSSIK